MPLLLTFALIRRSGDGQAQVVRQPLRFLLESQTAAQCGRFGFSCALMDQRQSELGLVDMVLVEFGQFETRFWIVDAIANPFEILQCFVSITTSLGEFAAQTERIVAPVALHS